MLESIEVKGYWWLPDKPEKQLPGTLTFSQKEGAFLELVGVFDTKQTKRVEQPTIILGINQKGNSFTLNRCHYQSWTYPLVGLGGAKYRARFVYEGVHFEKEADIKFNQLCGNYTDLDAWVDTHGFSIEENLEDGKFEFDIHYSKPDAKFVDINDSIEVGIDFSSHGPARSIVQTEVRIIQRSYLVVKCKKGDVSFDDLFSLLNRFSYLHQIAVQRMNYPVFVFGFTQANAEELDGGRKHYPKVNIFFQPVEPHIERKAKLPQEMLFTHKELDECFIKNWFNSFETFQTVIHLYRSLFYSNRLFIETRFLNIAQSLESLHNILLSGQKLPKEEFNARMKIVLEAVPDDLRNWVEAALKNANYKWFRIKILELLEKKTDLLSKCISDTDMFSRRVADTRIQFTHQNKTKRSFNFGDELVSAIYLLTFLFEAYVLESIGFPEDKIKEIYKPRIARYLSRWKKF